MTLVVGRHLLEGSVREAHSFGESRVDRVCSTALTLGCFRWTSTPRPGFLSAAPRMSAPALGQAASSLAKTRQLANQTWPNETSLDAALRTGADGDVLSFLPGQRLSACTCPGEDIPGPTSALVDPLQKTI